MLVFGSMGVQLAGRLVLATVRPHVRITDGLEDSETILQQMCHKVTNSGENIIGLNQ